MVGSCWHFIACCLNQGSNWPQQFRHSPSLAVPAQSGQNCKLCANLSRGLQLAATPFPLHLAWLCCLPIPLQRCHHLSQAED